MRRQCLWIVLSFGISSSTFADGTSQASHASPGPGCAPSLIESQRELPGFLRIGVLYRDVQGRDRLLTGAYLFGEHQALLNGIDPSSIASTLWMGELRMELRDGYPYIFEANETSKHYLDLYTSGWKAGDREIKVLNDFETIPLSMRSPTFKGHHFNQNELHLAPEFSGRKSNMRHEIRNSLTVFYLPIYRIRTWAGKGKVCPAMVEDIKARTQKDLEVVFQAVEYSVLKGIVKASQIPVVYDLIHQLTNPVTDCARVAAAQNADIQADFKVLTDSGLFSVWAK